MSASLEGLKEGHRRIEAELAACEALGDQAPALASRLKTFKPVMLEHLLAKDAFYAELKALCLGRGDLAAGNVAKSFEDNMRVQASAIRRFFESIEGAVSPLLAQSFRTMALVIKSRIATEERAVFPLYLKNRSTP
jgi:hypothetical protein